MKIDEIVKKQRDQLDVEEAPSALWENIRKEWKEEKKVVKSTNGAWKIAASILLVTTFGLTLYTWSLRQEVEQLASLGDISNEYRDIENQYQNEIKQLETAIPLKQISSSNSYKWLLDELETLDEVNKIYRADIGKVSNEAQLVQALMDYYEKKIKLLRKLELEIERETKNQREIKKDVKI